MNSQQYAAIAAACDRLLRAPDTSLARIAIPFLHVVNEHPGSVRQYEPLLGTQAKSDLSATTLAVRRVARITSRAKCALAVSLRRLPVRQEAARTMPGPTVLIVSHLSSPSQLDIEGDFYFGHLPQLLRQRGANPMLVLVDHLPNDQARRQCAAHPGAANRLILSQTVPIVTEARIWLQCALAAWRLRQAAHNTRQPSDANVALLASRHALLGGTAANLRLHAAVSQLCQQLKPDIVITTYEGTASERIIWHAARTAGRQPLCVGYQHTRLLQRAHAALRSVGAPGVACDPDVILTLGEITQAALAASPELSGARLITYGSHRRTKTLARSPGAERARSGGRVA